MLRAVVQVALDPSALLILRADQSKPGGAQLVEPSLQLGAQPGDGRIGYLLKDRVADEHEFLDAARRVGTCGSAIDRQVVAQLLSQRRSRNLIEDLTARERSVLGWMAEGRSNEAIAAELKISPKTPETRIGTIYSKLGLEPAAGDHRRVLAVLSFLRTS